MISILSDSWSSPLAWCSAAFLLCSLGCRGAGPDCDVPTTDPLRSVVDGQFMSGRGPFLPRAVNSYPLLEHAGWGRWDDIAEIFETARALGRPIVRTGAYMIGGPNPARLREADGTLREPGLVALDQLIATAVDHDVQLLLITANHWGNYGGAPAVVNALAAGEPIEAFYQDPILVQHQRAFLRALADRTNTVTGRRYAHDEAIAAWELVNEARCRDCDVSVLADWARVMAAELREVGVLQPIAWGGVGFLGQHGEDLRAIAAVDELDVITLHLYPGLAGALVVEPGRGRDRALVAVHRGIDRIHEVAVVGREFRKAVWVEEAGWRVSGAFGDEERAIVMGAWARAAGIEGVALAPWMIGERGRPDYDGFLVRPDRDFATARALRCSDAP